LVLRQERSSGPTSSENNLAILNDQWYDSTMATKLTTEQRDDLHQRGNKPVPVIDPVTNAVYFLVSSGVFDRLRRIFGDEVADVRETYASQSAVVGRAGWDDPEMNAYDAHKRPS